MKQMIRVMFVVATLFSMVATTIIPHHHHNDGETICSCHHISCCHEGEEDCTHQENHSDCSDCICSIKISLEQTNQLVKVPTPILIPALDIYSEGLTTLVPNIQKLYEEKGNFPPNLIHKYIFYRKSIALRAPPQF